MHVSVETHSNWCFLFLLEPRQKTLDLETACQMLELVLGPRPHVLSFLKFLEVLIFFDLSTTFDSEITCESLSLEFLILVGIRFYMFTFRMPFESNFLLLWCKILALQVIPLSFVPVWLYFRNNLSTKQWTWTSGLHSSDFVMRFDHISDFVALKTHIHHSQVTSNCVEKFIICCNDKRPFYMWTPFWGFL